MAHLNNKLDSTRSRLTLMHRVVIVSFSIAISMLIFIKITSSIQSTITNESVYNLISNIVNLSNNILVMTLLIVLTYSFVVIIREVKFLLSDDPLHFVLYRKLDYFFQNVGVFMKHSKNKVLIPAVRKVKNSNDIAFEIEVIGDKKEKLLSLNDSLNSYLAQKNVEYRIVESYEKEGWIRYILAPNYLADRLEGDSIEL